MAGMYKLPSGSWRIRWWHAGVRIGRTYATRDEAALALGRLNEVERGLARRTGRPFKLASGRYLIQWMLGRTRQSLTCDTIEEAEARLALENEKAAELKAANSEVRQASAALGDGTYISRQELSIMLAVPVGTISGWVHREEIPFVRLSPRMVRFERAAIEKWLAAGSVDANRAGEANADIVQGILEARLPVLEHLRRERSARYALSRPAGFGLPDETRDAIEAARQERLARRASNSDLARPT